MNVIFKTREEATHYILLWGNTNTFTSVLVFMLSAFGITRLDMSQKIFHIHNLNV